MTSSIEGSEGQAVNTVVEIYADEGCRLLTCNATLLKLGFL